MFYNQNTPAKQEERQATKEANAGMALLKKGNVQEAVPQFQHALKLGPFAGGLGYTIALEGMGETYDQQGQHEKSIAMYRTLVYVQPGQQWLTSRSNDCDVRMKFALALHHAGLYDEALFNYRKGMETLRHHTIDAPINITIKDNEADTDRLLYVIHLALAAQVIDFDDAEAVAHCRAAIKLHPETPIGHYYLGYILDLTPGSDRAEARKEVEYAANSHDNGIRLVAAHWLISNRYWNADGTRLRLPVQTPVKSAAPLTTPTATQVEIATPKS